ncbi:uncharacterized protein LY89DRAFT_788519 [Mollisia scopiformis]|uniref:Uncharacterized protein n=1 Tax=Mollisia scopiformis TaxID=149040 RepID=A0A132B9R8_MOLSC|nr:uncharacterized protein LY89DRAFT_788519 [Mollisia scopiformis]KUJ09121.1 hypothetical protein LY89DRAFT_788519 [Mollisia scopiformis]
MSEPISRRTDEDESFSLAPSIFFPFPGFTEKNTVPIQSLEDTEKLQKIIENLGVQQERVRGNMMFLVKQRAERLASKAKEELSTLDSDGEEDEKDKEVKEKNIDAMFANMRVLAKKGAKSAEYEVRLDSNPPVQTDVTMAGTELTTPASPLGGNGDVNMVSTRSSRQILGTLSAEMKILIDDNSSKMQRYDKHAKEVVNHYKQALERRNSRKGSGPAISGAAFGGGGMMASPVEMRRLSTGMPILGSFVGGPQPVRVSETMEELARRGSK